MLWWSGCLSQFWVSVCGYIPIYLAVYGPETKGSFGLEEKTKEVSGVRRTNFGGLWNVRSPIIDSHVMYIYVHNYYTLYYFYKLKK